MGFFSGAADELQAALIEQEARKRREMLDAITLKDSQSRDEDRKANREIQRENMAGARASREEANVATRQHAADSFENSTAQGTQLDDAGAAILDAAGRGSHYTRKPMTTETNVTTGLNPTADNPLGVDTSGKPALKVVEGQRLFSGTAKQQEETKQRADRAKFIQSLPPGDERKYYEAQDAVGDKTPSAYKPPTPAKTTYHSVQGVGLVQVDPDGQSRVLMHSKEHEPKPGQPFSVYDQKTGATRMFRVNPDNSIIELALPDGVSKTAPKPAPKTPAQIEAERHAATKGVLDAKKEAGASEPSMFNAVGNLLDRLQNGSSAPAPTPTAQPKTGDVKTFPNGNKAVFDGTGWVKQ